MAPRPIVRSTRALLGGVLAAGLMAAAPPPAVSAPVASAERAGTRVVDGCLDSVGDTETPAPVPICFTLFRPEGATARTPKPVVVHSHGWGGSRTTDPAAFEPFLSRGYAVLSFDQRGFGESGGKAHVENPRYEGQDVRRLVAMLASKPWIRQDGPGDPRMAAIGGSYGGGYQYLGAFEELRTRGEPVFDALAPEITWWDLRRSLAPAGAVRTLWALALSAAGANDVPREVLTGLAVGAAEGELPDGDPEGTPDLRAFFAKNGPSHHVAQGRRLDIPVLVGQGATDNLFPLEEGLTTFGRALTPEARRSSIFVGYNGGHTLPSAFPAGVGVAGDPCSRRLAGGEFVDLTVRFFDEQLRGRDTGLRGYGKYHLATAAPDGARCTTVSGVRADRTVDVEGPLATTTAAGAPVTAEVAQGPIRVAGMPFVTADVTALGVGNRAFYALAVGTSPADARIVQNNVLPISEPTPVTGEPRRIRLPAVAVDVPRGQNLYLLATPTSDMFTGMASRTPGVVSLDDIRVHLPVVDGRQGGA
ncbi:S9 family peptidase [Nocardioides sp. CFH 31398]|uniref:alpha/beta hydrolase family protein n=1 Tax=Nocardioides sp. CFH 31398 TaxID=2919579 RepID=UPI001F05B60F|nr:alpha/beta fold hydrolase [Nocardioides sp. CFH 31398]MCH1867617.1 CocE/NonD family hydrolase [Nocardioides sp. CFH 31398]